jgi:hypothetical protein
VLARMHLDSFILVVVFLCALLVTSGIFRKARKHLCSSFPFLQRVVVVKAMHSRLNASVLDSPPIPSIQLSKVDFVHVQ